MDRERTALLFAFLLLGVGVAAATTYPAVQDLTYTCQYNGSACVESEDTTSGICRTIGFTTTGGPLQVKVCHKEGNRYELYRQVSPAGAYQVCVESGCVDSMKGFASFTMDAVNSTNGTYTYVDPSTFSESCTFNGITCAKLSDTTAGTCRTVLYNVDNDTDEEIATLICHKGDSRYEFYRVFAPAGDLYVTMGPGFVDELKGYDSFTVPVTPPPPPPPVNATCVNATTVADVPVTCTGGNITTDAMSGTCRTVECIGDGSLKVLACEKPDSSTKLYYEMYKVNGGDGPVICIGAECLGDGLRGYQKSEDFCR